MMQRQVDYLGITANGNIDTDLDTLNIKGSVAPLDKINSLLGNIPFSGFSPVAKKVVAFSRRNIPWRACLMTRKFQPTSSALTPGIFRKIFGVLPDRGTSEDRGEQQT